jgi:hypothetical protein
MASGDVHTEPHGDGWANKVEGSERAASTHRTKVAAVKRGRDLAILRRVEHLIHEQDGAIAERNSYGGDPASPDQPLDGQPGVRITLNRGQQLGQSTARDARDLHL